ncbi:MAG: GNAT family N-acetyltransferase [Chloroflexi bacterium]|nr:GNAT family N-acetyltransferase [Chloroflexota bacterium]
MRVILSTERLQLRQFTVEDTINLYTLDRDPGARQYLPGEVPATVDGYLPRIEAHFRYYQSYAALGFWAIEERVSHTFVGSICLRPARDFPLADELEYTSDEYELGYRLRTAAWGKGYATELARALIARAFTELHLPNVVAATSIENIGSWKVMEKVGMQCVGEYILSDDPIPVVKYRITRAEYTANA